MSQNRTALLPRPSRVEPHEAPRSPELATESRDQLPSPASEARKPSGPRRWNDPDEKLMLWGLLFFFGLGLYAVAFILFGMWLTPSPWEPA